MADLNNVIEAGEEYRKTDWRFDFESLPYWDNRKTIFGVFDDFHYIPQSDTLCCIYSIAEVSMCRYMGFLAILKNKEKPELILNIAHKMNFYRNFFVSQKGNIIFLQPFIYNKKTKKSSCPIMIIDIENRKFAYYDAEDYGVCHKISEISDQIFSIESDESSYKTIRKTEIDLSCLDWFDFSKLKKCKRFGFNMRLR
ncbi:MAG: hypothetical protein IJD37_06575 [Clostridia bacterium]|nr:hypothetical protein [Clostridia bacterium]